jgi:hypothetical protein
MAYKKDYLINGRALLQVAMSVDYECCEADDVEHEHADVWATCQAAGMEPQKIVFQVLSDVVASWRHLPSGSLALGFDAGIEDAVYQLFLDLGGDKNRIDDDFSNLWETMDDMLSEVIEDAQTLFDGAITA